MENIINSLVSKAVGVTDQQIKDFLATGPSDAQIVAAMGTYGVSPSQMAQVTGIPEGQVAARVAATIPPGQTVTLGDTIVQPQYQTIGQGQDQQIGGLENVLTYKTGENKVGGGYNQYDPTGQLQRTGTQQEVNANKDFLKFAALAAGGLYGLGGLGELGAGVVPGAGTTFAGEALADAGLLSGGGSASLGSMGTLGADYGLGTGASNVAGMGTGTGITGGYSGLGINAGTAGLGAEGLGAGITAGSGLTGTGVLAGSTLGEGLLGSSALNNLTGTGVLAGSGLGTSLLGTNAGAGLTGTGILSGSNLGTSLLGTGPGSAVTGGVTGLGGTNLGTGALTTGVGSGGGLGGVVGGGTGNLITGGGTGTNLGSALGTTLGQGLGLSALGTGLGALANQSGISDARNLINQYGGIANTQLGTAYQNAQNLNAANRTDLGNIYANTTGNMQNLYNQQVGYQNPYQDIGRAGSQGLLANQDYLTRQFTNADLNANLAPNYAFQLGQGQMANQRAANMGGGALSGNALQGLQRYTQDYAGGAYQNAFNNFNTQRQNIYNTLSGMANIGTTSAGQLAGLGNTYGSNMGSLASNYGSNLTQGYGQGIGAANAYGLNTANLATGIGSALAGNAVAGGANTANALNTLGNTALLGSMIKAT